jgi:hypothetical protein
VLAHHYSGSYPAATVQFGLYDVVDGERRLCGVAVFGVPVSTAVLTKPLPELRPYTESLVCSRFGLLDECPGNSESWFLANCLNHLLASGVRGVVSFADPVPRRTASGVLVMPGHVGTIYAATNAVYASRATARTVKLLPDGTVFHERTAQKIRRQEQGHQYAEAQLIALGAPVPRAGCSPAVWLREALVAVGARNVRHRGAHRFCGRFSRVAAWPMTVPGREGCGGCVPSKPHHVATLSVGTKVLNHPVAGELSLDWDTLTASTDPDQQLVVWTAEGGSPTHDGLRILASWAAERHQPIAGPAG